MVAVNPTDVWVALRTGRGWTDPQPGPDESWMMPPDHDVMLHWNGHRWRRVPLPELHDPITNLTAQAPDDVWGVGGVDGLVRWNGTHWRTVAVRQWRRHDPEVGRVATLAADDAWLSAAGYTTQGSDALVEHWDGHRWGRVRTPTMPGRRTKLSAVAAASPDDAWAFGAYATGDGSVHRTSGIVTEHWDGRRWTLVAQPAFHHTKRWFEMHDAVMLSHTDGWAVGRQAAPFKPVVLHWNGTQWSASPTRGCCELFAIAARNPEDVWAVGYNSNGDGYQARIDRWNGRRWQTIPTPTGGSNTTLNAVSTLTTGETLVAGTTTNSTGTSYPILLRYSR